MMCTSGRFSTSINQSLIFLLPYLVSLMIISSSNGRGTCYGDSGGPAIVKQPDGSYVQVQPLRNHSSLIITIYIDIVVAIVVWQLLCPIPFTNMISISNSNSVFRLEFSLLEHWLVARKDILVDRFVLYFFYIYGLFCDPFYVDRSWWTGDHDHLLEIL